MSASALSSRAIKALLTQGYAVRVVNKFAKKQTSSAPIKTDKSKIKGLNRGL